MCARRAFSTGDRATIQDSLGDLWRKVSNENAFFLVTDPEGKTHRIARWKDRHHLAQ